MENRKHIESLGFVIKKEKLSNLASDFRFNELLLEDLDPFPGFYDHFHIPMSETEQKPRSIFAIIKSMSFEDMDDFIRITRTIKKEFKHRFDAVMGRLELQNSLVSCIRIYMEDYSVLPELIGLYAKQGIVFHANKTVKPFSSLINVRKYFVLDEVAPEIYQDEDLADTYYFSVDRYLPWNKFETVTVTIRNNWDHKVYDAAQAGIYTKNGVVELVRIYDRNATMEHLQYLKEKYRIEANRCL